MQTVIRNVHVFSVDRAYNGLVVGPRQQTSVATTAQRGW